MHTVRLDTPSGAPLSTTDSLIDNRKESIQGLAKRLPPPQFKSIPAVSSSIICVLCTMQGLLRSDTVSQGLRTRRRSTNKNCTLERFLMRPPCMKVRLSCFPNYSQRIYGPQCSYTNIEEGKSEITFTQSSYASLDITRILQQFGPSTASWGIWVHYICIRKPFGDWTYKPKEFLQIVL